MKTLAKLMAAGLALLIVNIAFASATLRDVQTAVTVNKDFRQAENLIREVVANDPNSARDHYVYSQILRHNGKHDDALRELTEAKRLDPAITFDKNPARVFAYEASLKAERGRQPAFDPQAGAAQPATEPAALAAAPLQPEREPGHPLLWVALILGVLGVAGYFFYRRVQEHDRMEDDQRMNLARQDQMKQASALLESVKPLKLDIRMASPANLPLLADVEAVEVELVNLIDRLGKLPVPQGDIDRQAESLAHLRRTFEGKPDPVAAVQPGYENAQPGVPAGFGNSATGPATQQSGPQTVYAGNNGGGVGGIGGIGGIGGVGGLLAGLALGSMMGGGHDREVIREIREAPGRRDDDNSGGQSDIDFGNDSDSNDSNSGVDFGGSDDS
jgi:tetratricopeptide (TPR) repeat protein